MEREDEYARSPNIFKPNHHRLLAPSPSPPLPPPPRISLSTSIRRAAYAASRNSDGSCRESKSLAVAAVSKMTCLCSGREGGSKAVDKEREQERERSK